MVASIDVDAFEVPRERSKRAPQAWLLDNMPAKRPMVVASLEEGVAVRVLVEQNERREIWVGVIALRRNASVTLRLWGSGRLWTVRLEMILRAGVVPSHSFSEFEAACRNQRNGQPAGFETHRKRKMTKPAEPQGPVIELSDETFQRVEGFAVLHEMTFDAAFDRLIAVGRARLLALEKWNESLRRARASDDESVMGNSSNTTRSIDRVIDCV